MLITMLTAGSRGDTQPYVALGKGLQAAGYNVRIAASESFEAFVHGHGLDFWPLPGDMAQLAQSPEAVAAMKADNPLKFFQSFQRALANPTLRKLMVDIQAASFTACEDADAVIYHPGAAIGHFAARHLQIPSILAAPFPMTPTRAYPALIFYGKLRLGGVVNRLSHQLFEIGFWQGVRPAVKAFWQQTFGALPPHFGNPYRQQRANDGLTLVGSSNHVMPKAADWPQNTHATGYWFLDARADWQPPAALAEFLAAGPPPVYVGFGSVGDPETRAETTALVKAALRQAGQRGVLATGWQGLDETETLGVDFFVLKSAPHTWLFPRMTAVVHHGGAGTTAAGLRAGVPAVVVPHGNDQFAWGRRVQELGVGAAPIPRKKLTAENLAAAITTALQADVKAAAADLGAKIRSEDGVATAVALLQAHLT